MIRGQPVSHWDLRLSEGKPAHRYWHLDKDPTHVQKGINGVLKKCDDERWLTFEGIIPPKPKAPKWLKPGNPNKRIVAHVDRIDEGIVTIIEDSPTFISFLFKGKQLKGYWVIRKVTPAENVWIFEKSKLPRPAKKQNDRSISPDKIEKILELSKDDTLSRPEIARRVHCATSTVWRYQREYGLL